MVKKAVQFGAGNIGRGFIGLLLSKAGYEVIFADVNQEIVEEINEKKMYQVILASEAQEKITVTGIRAINSATNQNQLVEAIKTADLITTAVGATVLPTLAKVIAMGIEQRKCLQKEVTIIACENMIGGSKLLEQAVRAELSIDGLSYLNRFVAFPNAAVDRIVPQQSYSDRLTVTVEPFYEWVVEEVPIDHHAPNIDGLTYVPDLTPYIERKLFTVNTGHAVTAYFGYLKNIQSIEDAIHNEKVAFVVRSALEETGALLEKKFKFSHKEHQEYIDKIIARFKNPYISDDVSRVGRSPIRKIGENDRFIQPAKQFAEAFNETPKALAAAIAAALKFYHPSDEEAVVLKEAIEDHGLENAIEQYTGLKPYSKLFEKVKESYMELV